MAEERKVCVVTGSSSGIGAATVKLYAKQGWNVVVNYSREAGGVLYLKRDSGEVIAFKRR